MGYLDKIDSPSDLKKLNESQMTELSAEIRSALLKKLSIHGGHCGPNLGMVEATIALHYVFDSPKDKFVFDISHQSYVHKMLTGRRKAFTVEADYDDVTGFSEPCESEHDFFTIGHTSTAVSLAAGLAKGRDLAGRKENIVAILGDGSLSGGEALEGLDFVGETKTNFIVVFNDNQMSIAENHGGLYENLEMLRKTNGTCPCNLFKAMGLDYIYVDKGNDIHSLIEAFEKVKDIDHPIVVHINTLKGKGYEPAVENKEAFHFTPPFDLATGKPLHAGDAENYSSITVDYLLEKMKHDPSVVVMNAATPGVIGFTPDKRKLAGHQFVDVGIAEEHAVAMASGLAKAGAKPVLGLVSTFLQRTYDQLSQDLCVNNNPAVLLVFWGSLTAMNDVTHLCWFDIPLVSNIPNMVYLAPTCKEEYLAMLEWGMEQTDHPVAIRVPATDMVESCGHAVEADFSQINKYEVVSRGSEVAILALGSFFGLGKQVSQMLEAQGIKSTLINPRFITGVDEELMRSLEKDHRLVVTLEDGVLDGGFGEKISRFFGTSPMKVINFGGKKEFLDHFDEEELLKANHLTAPQIVDDIKEALA